MHYVKETKKKRRKRKALWCANEENLHHE